MKNLALFFLAIYLLPFVASAKNNSPLSIDGFVNFSAALRNQASVFEQKKLPNNLTTNHLENSSSIENDSQIFFKTNFETRDKIKYGAVAKLEFNFNSDGKNEKPNLDQVFIFAQNNFGKFELGNYQAVNQKMKAGAARLARGAGGINGKYLENVNLPMTSNSSFNVKLPQFILLAQSPIGHGGYARSFYQSGETVQNDFNSFNRSNFRALKDDSFDGVEDATKLSYYSPKINGLQLGISYAPNSADSGITSTKYYNVSAIQINNIVSFGANYAQDFDNIGLEISATAEKGQAKNSQSNTSFQRANLSAYDVGANLSYFGFNFGVSYGSWQKSLQAKNGIYSCDYDSSASLAAQNCQTNGKKFSDPYYYATGVSYSFGPVAASITTLKSVFQKNNYNAVSVGVDYKLARDLMPYFELTKFTFKSNQPKASDADSSSGIKDNRGYVFLTGVLISF